MTKVWVRDERGNLTGLQCAVDVVAQEGLERRRLTRERHAAMAGCGLCSLTQGCRIVRFIVRPFRT